MGVTVLTVGVIVDVPLVELPVVCDSVGVVALSETDTHKPILSLHRNVLKKDISSIVD